MQLKSVVLPAPLGPIRPQIAPGATSKLTSSRAVTPPKRIETPSTASSADPQWPASALLALASASSMDFPFPAVAGFKRTLAAKIDVSGKIVTCFVAGSGANGGPCLGPKLAFG